MKRALIVLCLAGAQALAAQQAPVRFAQGLVNAMVRAHEALTAVELAVDSAGTCKTIAATDPKDVGERCDDDEIGPMRTGEPDVAAPTRDDPVYDVTQALHDATGRHGHPAVRRAGPGRRASSRPRAAARARGADPVEATAVRALIHRRVR